MTKYFAEIFPLGQDTIPELSTYRLDIDTIAGDFNTIGGKLSYRLQKEFKGNWAYSSGVIITDNPQNEGSLQRFLDTVRSNDSKTYRSLRGLTLAQDVPPAKAIQAHVDFMVRKIETELQEKAQNELGIQDIGNAIVKREIEFRGWIVEGQPAISISIDANVIYKDDLSKFISKVPDFKEIEGLRVRSKNSSTLKGRILSLSGNVSQRRSDLISIATTESSKNFIRKASNEERVLWVQAQNREKYEYVASQLNVIVESKFYRQLGIDGKVARKATVLSPQTHAEYVGKASQILKKVGYIRDAYSSENSAGLFLTAKSIGYTPQIRVGSNQIVEHNPKTLLNNLKQHGLYSSVQGERAVKIGVIIAVKDIPSNSFWESMRSQIEALGTVIDSTVPIEEISNPSPANIERAVDALQNQNVDFILSILPKENLNRQSSKVADWQPYVVLKRLTIQRGIPNQVIGKETLTKNDAVDNVALGVISKLGNIPFVLAEPLPYTDIVVGLDIAREQKERLRGSKSTAASIQVYQSNGQFLRYKLHDAQLDGETIPPDDLRSLFPINVFSNKRVLVHRDGYFRAKKVLLNWAEELDSTFYLVEIIKKRPPRLYVSDENGIQRPEKGGAIRLSDTEAIYVSSPPPFGNAMPQPLRIRTQAPFTIEQAIHSALSLTLLHHGSLLPPRLPVSIHHSDRIAYLALRNIKPATSEGTDQYWL